MMPIVFVRTNILCSFPFLVKILCAIPILFCFITCNVDSSHAEVQSSNSSQREFQFSHQWAAHIKGGVTKAKQLAEFNGFEYLGEIFPDHYHLRHKRIMKRSLRPSPHVHRRMAQHDSVRWMEQQVIKRRVKRDGWPPGRRKKKRDRSKYNQRNIAFNDAKWSEMWYLKEDSKMNVVWAWRRNITGDGVVVTIMDDGLEKSHPDIAQNFDELASFDMNDNKSDPTPRYDIDGDNKHGTRCAGEVAAKENNQECIVGIAFGARIGGIRMLDGDVTDAVEARSLGYNRYHIDIYSASWGPDDDGVTLDGPAHLAAKAFEDGVKFGRNGLGSIFVWASGNGGRNNDDCNCDGYANSIYTISISAASQYGQVPWYSERCASTLATTFSSGDRGDMQIVTTDINNSCTNDHTGTSASAPLAAGICALALQANRMLTWRDMQYLIVYSSNHKYLGQEKERMLNGAGRLVSHAFGYGLMDADKIVRMAEKWTTVPRQKMCEVESDKHRVNIHNEVNVQLTTNACRGSRSRHVLYLEHVQVRLTMTAQKRGDLEISLKSPMGTISKLLAVRPGDTKNGGVFNDWEFMSVHFWGETAAGTWSLRVKNYNHMVSSDTKQELHTWSLILYGVDRDPQPLLDDSYAGKKLKTQYHKSKLRSTLDEQLTETYSTHQPEDSLDWLEVDKQTELSTTETPPPSPSPRVSYYYCGSQPSTKARSIPQGKQLPAPSTLAKPLGTAAPTPATSSSTARLHSATLVLHGIDSDVGSRPKSPPRPVAVEEQEETSSSSSRACLTVTHIIVTVITSVLYSS